MTTQYSTEQLSSANLLWVCKVLIQIHYLAGELRDKRDQAMIAMARNPRAAPAPCELSGQNGIAE